MTPTKPRTSFEFGVQRLYSTHKRRRRNHTRRASKGGRWTDHLFNQLKNMQAHNVLPAAEYLLKTDAEDRC